MDSSFGLQISFIDQSESFVLGFEAGMIYQLVKEGVEVHQHLAHTSNLPMIERIANNAGLTSAVDPTDTEGWAYVTLIPKPRTLSVVKSGMPPHKFNADINELSECQHCGRGKEHPNHLPRGDKSE